MAERVKEWTRQWREEGREEGREVGREEGREVGRRQGEAEVLIRLFQQKFGPLDEDSRRRIEQAESEQRLVWAERILTAERVEDVFG